MRCPSCRAAEMTIRRVNYKYDESGLTNVTIVGQRVAECPKCGEHGPIFERLEAMHRALALALALKPAQLTGKEARFVRKTLGFSGVDFSKFLGVEPETVSRWENEKVALSPQLEVSVRLAALLGQEAPPYDELEKLFVESRDKKKAPAEISLKLGKRGWEPELRA